MMFSDQHSNNPNWIEPRPIVVVEDHFHHISKLTQSINKVDPTIFDVLTVVCLDRPGPDTTVSMIEQAERHRTIQMAGALDPHSLPDSISNRIFPLDESIFQNQTSYCKTIAGFVRHEGLLIQDIELESLDFIPKDRWWESTFLATTVRGIFGPGNLACAFFSNKRGYEATFGAELLAAGHDPRDVLNKNDLDQVVVPKMSRFIQDKFSWNLTYFESDQSKAASIRITSSERERKWVHGELDLVIWPETNQSILAGGKAFANPAGHSFAVNSNEAITWVELAKSALHEKGLSTQEVGSRIAPPGATKAESTNSAARHIHSLRKRLKSSDVIVTVDGHYRIADGVQIGIVEAI